MKKKYNERKLQLIKKADKIRNLHVKKEEKLSKKYVKECKQKRKRKYMRNW